ncbi:Lrp/AsnC family transcriptional regulator [Novosphingobium panipatense]|uniref:Lrp/AsnC family transcriptional regulator n=1 Tax=Novosphingobium panipatense TaxID=428991 RepID=UPI0039A1B77F
MINLDEIDRRLLAELQAEGRITNVELAQRVGLTAPPCLRRVRSLEEAGVIQGYHADLDASKLGFTITVFALVSLKSQAEEFLTSKLTPAPNVDSVKTSLTIRTAKNIPGVPLG